MGCKPTHSAEITARLFDHLRGLEEDADAEEVRQMIKQKYPARSSRGLIAVLSHPHYLSLIKAGLGHLDYTKPEQLADFRVASDITEHKRSFIILLCGTSGTGKSTLASLLASRLGITKVIGDHIFQYTWTFSCAHPLLFVVVMICQIQVISTDSIRHVLRTCVPREENLCLFASTYEAGDLMLHGSNKKNENSTSTSSDVLGNRFSNSIELDPLASSPNKLSKTASEKLAKRRHKQRVLLGHHIQVHNNHPAQ
jgi:hypothetical protein